MPVNKSVWLALLTAGWTIACHADVIHLDGGVNQIFLLDVNGSGVAEAFSRGTALNDRGQVAGYYRITRDIDTATSNGFTARPVLPDYDYGAASAVVTPPPPNPTYNRVFAWGLNAPPNTSGGRTEPPPVLVGGARLSGPATNVVFAFYGVQDPANGQYTLQSIGGYNGQGGLPTRYSEAKGVNNAGVAVGYVCSGSAGCLKPGSGSPSAFRYDGNTGQLTEGFAGMNAVASQARAINSAGMIAGAFTPSGGSSHALRYDFASQSGTDLHPYLPSPSGAQLVASTATAINDASDRPGTRVGDIAGTATYSLNPGQGSGNQRNVAFLLRAGQTQATLLDPAQGYEGSAAAAIDQFGAVVGTACATGAGCGSFNDSGADARPEDNTAMLWVNGFKVDLSAIGNLAATGWTKLSFADAVTRVGDLELISGVGYYDFDGTSGVERRAFLLRLDANSLPVPEPHAWLLFAAGLVALASRRLRGLAG
jgi:hypothetical protein